MLSNEGYYQLIDIRNVEFVGIFLPLLSDRFPHFLCDTPSSISQSLSLCTHFLYLYLYLYLSIYLFLSLSHSLYVSLQLPLSLSPTTSFSLSFSLTCTRTFTHCFSLCNSRLCYLIFYFPVSLTRFLIRLSYFHFLNHHLSLSQSPFLPISIITYPSLNLLFSLSLSQSPFLPISIITYPSLNLLFSLSESSPIPL